MLERITIENFKSLQKVDLRLGPLNIFIGPNASGKSNFIEVLQILQGLSLKLNITEVFDGVSEGETLRKNIAWEGVRGGSRQALTRGATQLKIKIGTEVRLDNDLHKNRLNIFFSSPHNLVGASEGEKPLNVRGYFADQQHLDFSLPRLRDYSSHPKVTRLGKQGDNFAALVNTLLEDPRTKTAYLSWLQELTPDNVDDVKTILGALGEPLFAIVKNGQDFPAPMLSDGTLRFAALTAALFQPDAPNIIVIEEIETGIHPARLHLLLELLRSRAALGKTQFFITTHSPFLLDWLTPEERDYTFICQREEGGATTIRSLSAIPGLSDVIEQTPLSQLMAEGWLEVAP